MKAIGCRIFQTETHSKKTDPAVSSLLMKKLISIIPALCLASTVFGGPQPGAPSYWFVGFDLTRQAWYATDILIVNEGEKIDGKVTVEEVLHGSKTVGEKLEFPGLAKLADPKERTTYLPDPDAPPSIYRAHLINRTEGLKPKVISGHQMILFLGGGGAEIVVNYTSGTMRVPPKPDNIDEHPITRNVALIDDDRLFAQSGRIDAPTITVVNLGLSVMEARKAIAEILSDRATVEQCEEMTDAKARASEAAPLMDSENFLAMQKGFEILIGCGAEANPHVHTFVDKNLPVTGVENLEGIGRVTSFLRKVWFSFAKAESEGRPGEDFAPVVTEIADKEMEFWRREAPGLPENWWNEQKFEARFAWHNRLNLTEMLVRALGAINTPETRRKIAEIRDFLKSQPRLMDKEGPDYLYGLCLAELGEVPVRR